MIWSGHGAAVVAEGLRHRNQKMLFRSGVLSSALIHVTVATLLFSLYLGLLLTRPFEMGREEKVLGHWIKQHLGPGAKIMERIRVVPFYADGVPVGLPYAPLNEVLEYGVKQDAEYLVISEDQWHHPSLRMLLKQPQIPPELSLVHTINRSTESQIHKKIALYRLRERREK